MKKDEIKNVKPALQQHNVSRSSLTEAQIEHQIEMDDEEDSMYMDDDEFEEMHGNSEAENCTCGAYKWANGCWVHVSDCCC